MFKPNRTVRPGADDSKYPEPAKLPAQRPLGRAPLLSPFDLCEASSVISAELLTQAKLDSAQPQGNVFFPLCGEARKPPSLKWLLQHYEQQPGWGWGERQERSTETLPPTASRQ